MSAQPKPAPFVVAPRAVVETKAPWMQPARAVVTRQPSWLKMQPYVAEAPPPSVRQPSIQPGSKSRPSMAAVQMPSSAPPRSVRPSVPPPASSRHGAPIIQSTREVELEAEVAALHTELARVIDESERVRARVMEESEPQVVALALAIARRVVGRELTTDPGLVQHWIQEALGTLPEGAVYVAKDVKPEEGQTVDVSLPKGTAELRDGASTVAIGAEPRIEAMADALGIDP